MFHILNVVQHMKRTLKILILLVFSKSFGQVNNDSIPNKFEFIEKSIITDLCKNASEWTEKKACSKQEIIKKIKKELKLKL